MVQEHNARKKAGKIKAKVAKLEKALESYIGKLKTVHENMIAAKDLNQRTCVELAHRYAKCEKTAEEMEEYYNERIQYYKSVYMHGCDKCLKRRAEAVELHGRHAHSLEKIRKLQCKAEFEHLKKKFSKTLPMDNEMDDHKGTG